MSDSAEHRQSSASATRPQVEQLLGLRRDGTSGGAEGGGAEGGVGGGGAEGGVGGGGAEGGVGGGVPEDCDGGEDTGVIRLWRKAFSGLKLAKEKSSKKKKRSSIDESEDIDPVYSLLKLAADRGTQKCAACCTQSDKLSPAAEQQQQQQSAVSSRRHSGVVSESAAGVPAGAPAAVVSPQFSLMNTLAVPAPGYAAERKYSLPTPESVLCGADRRRLDQSMKSASVDRDRRAESLAPPSPRAGQSNSPLQSPSLSLSPSPSASPARSPLPPLRRRVSPRTSPGRELPPTPGTKTTTSGRRPRRLPVVEFFGADFAGEFPASAGAGLSRPDFRTAGWRDDGACHCDGSQSEDEAPSVVRSPQWGGRAIDKFTGVQLNFEDMSPRRSRQMRRRKRYRRQTLAEASGSPDRWRSESGGCDLCIGGACHNSVACKGEDFFPDPQVQRRRQQSLCLQPQQLSLLEPGEQKQQRSTQPRRRLPSPGSAVCRPLND